MPTFVAQRTAPAPRLRSVLRMAAAFTFMQAGKTKLVAFPAGIPPRGGPAPFRSLL